MSSNPPTATSGKPTNVRAVVLSQVTVKHDVENNLKKPSAKSEPLCKEKCRACAWWKKKDPKTRKQLICGLLFAVFVAVGLGVGAHFRWGKRHNHHHHWPVFPSPTPTSLFVVFGDNQNCELGLGQKEDGSCESAKNATFLFLEPSPSPIDDSHRFKIAAGIDQTAIILSNGSLLIAGNTFLGDGSNKTVHARHTQVTGLNNDTIQSVCLGSGFVVATSHNGSVVYGWGQNNVGQLGVGDFDNKAVVQQYDMTAVFGGQRVVRQVACGVEHVVFLTSSSEVFMTGLFGSARASRMDILSSVYGNVTQVAMGRSHVVVRTNFGRVLTWGSNEYGQLCRVTATNFTTSPSVISYEGALSDEASAARVGAGSWHTLFFAFEPDLLDAKLYGCGRNDFGQLCNQNLTSSNPHPVNADTSLGWDDSILAITGGDLSTFFLGDRGLYGCGLNEDISYDPSVEGSYAYYGMTYPNQTTTLTKLRGGVIEYWLEFTAVAAAGTNVIATQLTYPIVYYD